MEQTLVPNDYEAEQATLGSVIYNNESFADLSGILTPSAYYNISNQLIYSAMLDLDRIGQPIDELTLGDHLKSKNQLAESGGYAYLATLQDCVPGSGNVEHYARIIQEHFISRQIIKLTNDIQRKAREPQFKPIEILAELEVKTLELAIQQKTEDIALIKDITKEAVLSLEKVSSYNDEITGIPSGIPDLDKKTSGFQNSDLILIAGRPSMGKTALAMNIGTHAAKHTEGDVLIFSMEMSSVQLTLRILGSEGKVDSNLMRNGNLEQEDWDRLAMAINSMSMLKLGINDKAALTNSELISIAKKHHKMSKNGVSLVIIDYLQLMRSSRKTFNREQEIADISRSLKKLAKDLNCPVIALSQLNRALENRSEKRPLMSDLRESGALEQDSDIIMFIYRDEVYNPETSDPGIAEINIAKHRNGPIGHVKTVFVGKYTTFANP